MIIFWNNFWLISVYINYYTQYIIWSHWHLFSYIILLPALANYYCCEKWDEIYEERRKEIKMESNKWELKRLMCNWIVWILFIEKNAVNTSYNCFLWCVHVVRQAANAYNLCKVFEKNFQFHFFFFSLKSSIFSFLKMLFNTLIFFSYTDICLMKTQISNNAFYFILFLRRNSFTFI
jgi:hypothetical protein